MSKFLKYAVGIDVSKDSFHVCLSVIDTLQKVTIKASRSFANQSKGFQELTQWVKNHRKEEDIQTSRRLFPTTQNVKERPARTMYQG